MNLQQSFYQNCTAIHFSEFVAKVFQFQNERLLLDNSAHSIQIESTKTTSMEDVSTGVLEKSAFMYKEEIS